MTTMEKTIKKFKRIFNETIENGPDYNGSLKKMDFFKMTFLHETEGSIHSHRDGNISMYRYKYLEHDSVLMVFSIPLHPDLKNSNADRRHINDRVMSIMRECENSFITLDYRSLEKVNAMMYLVCIKKIESKEK